MDIVIIVAVTAVAFSLMALGWTFVRHAVPAGALVKAAHALVAG